MVPIRHIKTTACPICGCKTIVAESVELELNRQDIRRRCNGGQWEYRSFACGYQTKFIPNFFSEAKGASCRNDPELIERGRKAKELKAQIMEVIESSDAPDCVKTSFADRIRYK